MTSKKQLKYILKYKVRRYHNDREYRAKIREYARKFYQEHRTLIRIKQRIAYHALKKNRKPSSKCKLCRKVIDSFAMFCGDACRKEMYRINHLKAVKKYNERRKLNGAKKKKEKKAGFSDKGVGEGLLHYTDQKNYQGDAKVVV